MIGEGLSVSQRLVIIQQTMYQRLVLPQSNLSGKNSNQALAFSSRNVSGLLDDITGENVGVNQGQCELHLANFSHQEASLRNKDGGATLEDMLALMWPSMLFTSIFSTTHQSGNVVQSIVSTCDHLNFTTHHVFHLTTSQLNKHTISIHPLNNHMSSLPHSFTIHLLPYILISAPPILQQSYIRDEKCRNRFLPTIYTQSPRASPDHQKRPTSASSPKTSDI
jgi:hypothetical protein